MKLPFACSMMILPLRQTQTNGIQIQFDLFVSLRSISFNEKKERKIRKNRGCFSHFTLITVSIVLLLLWLENERHMNETSLWNLWNDVISHHISPYRTMHWILLGSTSTRIGQSAFYRWIIMLSLLTDIIRFSG